LLFLVRLRFVPASGCALGRRVVQGQAHAQIVNRALMSDGIALQEGFAALAFGHALRRHAVQDG
jgi:hypothetical protein